MDHTPKIQLTTPLSSYKTQKEVADYPVTNKSSADAACRPSIRAHLAMVQVTSYCYIPDQFSVVHQISQVPGGDGGQGTVHICSNVLCK